ncbi:MAG: hypothetical protein OXE48_00730, partial [Gammaproteobacteria bacterium]|nr:hypothetical protein [Gammaproteobacteria bacterium]
ISRMNPQYLTVHENGATPLRALTDTELRCVIGGEDLHGDSQEFCEDNPDGTYEREDGGWEISLGPFSFSWGGDKIKVVCGGENDDGNDDDDEEEMQDDNADQ